MSQITKKDVEKIAKLARIEIDDSKKELLATQLSSTITWVETLNEVNTDNIKILTNVHNIAMPLFADEISDGDYAPQILKNSPQVKYDYFTVPKVIE